MLEFIKMFGLGILYTIASPILLVVFLLFVVVSLINYLIQEVIYLVGFFMGKKYTTQTPLENKLKEIKAQKVQIQNNSNSEGGDLNA